MHPLFLRNASQWASTGWTHNIYLYATTDTTSPDAGYHSYGNAGAQQSQFCVDGQNAFYLTQLATPCNGTFHMQSFGLISNINDSYTFTGN
jgi:hypothetical protein